jgi:hypothetical protein
MVLVAVTDRRLDTRELLRTRKNPLQPDQVRRLRGVRPAGPPPRPSTAPIRVQRRAPTPASSWSPGTVALGRQHQRQTVTVLVCHTTLAIELPDGNVTVVRRSTTQPVRSLKGQRPRTATSFS